MGSRPVESADGIGSGLRQDEREALRREVIDGLSRPQKELSSKHFYDQRGSELFERITRLPEYYLTRTEESLLREPVAGWVEALSPRTLVELGAGSARKTRTLLDAMRRSGESGAFVPVDVSGDFLNATAAQVRREYPGFAVRPVVADLTQPLSLGGPLVRPALFVLLGSTIGNFPDAAAVELLSGVSAGMGSEDRFLLGADLRPGPGKTVAQIESAYNDAAGVTAAFNLNVLRVLNRTIGADFKLDHYRHRAFYNPDEHRIEMHLLSRLPHSVHFPSGESVQLERGETIRTEISGKYDRVALESIMAAAGLGLERWAQDADGRFSQSLWRIDAQR